MSHYARDAVSHDVMHAMQNERRENNTHITRAKRGGWKKKVWMEHFHHIFTFHKTLKLQSMSNVYSSSIDSILHSFIQFEIVKFIQSVIHSFILFFNPFDTTNRERLSFLFSYTS